MLSHAGPIHSGIYAWTALDTTWTYDQKRMLRMDNRNVPHWEPFIIVVFKWLFWTKRIQNVLRQLRASRWGNILLSTLQNRSGFQLGDLGVYTYFPPKNYLILPRRISWPIVSCLTVFALLNILQHGICNNIGRYSASAPLCSTYLISIYENLVGHDLCNELFVRLCWTRNQNVHKYFI